MGSQGEVWADAGLHINSGSFAAYAAELKASEEKISEFSSTSSTLMAGAFAAPAAVTAGVVGEGVKLASGFQDAGVSLTNLYGSADVAREKFQWMTTFAAKTPFQFDEIENASIKLKSYGMDIETYGRTMGDTAANMGKDINEVVEAYADAGQGEFERLKEFGIKAVQVQKSNLDQYAQYGAAVGDTVLTYTDKNGQAMAQVVDRNNSQMVYSTLNNIFDVEKGFKGAMETRSQTLSGMMSNITDNLTSGLTDMVGYDMKTMSVESGSLLSAFMGLAQGALTLTGGFAGLSEPMQTAIVIGTGAVSIFGLLATASIAYGAVLPLITADTFLFGVTLSAAIWPVTAIVAGAALLAAGLVYLDEKTGLVSEAWQLMSDIFTIAYYHISADFNTFKTDVIEDVQEIQQWVADIIPDWVVNGITGTIDTLKGKFDDWAGKTHEDAQAMHLANDDLSTSFTGLAGSVDTTTKSTDKSKTATDAAIVSYKGAATGMENYNTQTKSTTSGLSSYTSKTLEAVTATNQLWAAQQKIASQAITIREAEKTVGEGWASSGGKGSTSSEGVTVIAAPSSSSSSGAGLGSMSGTNALTGNTTVIHVGTINNNGASISANQTAMAVHGVA